MPPLDTRSYYVQEVTDEDSVFFSLSKSLPISYSRATPAQYPSYLNNKYQTIFPLPSVSLHLNCRETKPTGHPLIHPLALSIYLGIATRQRSNPVCADHDPDHNEPLRVTLQPHVHSVIAACCRVDPGSFERLRLLIPRPPDRHHTIRAYLSLLLFKRYETRSPRRRTWTPQRPQAGRARPTLRNGGTGPTSSRSSRSPG